MTKKTLCSEMFDAYCAQIQKVKGFASARLTFSQRYSSVSSKRIFVTSRKKLQMIDCWCFPYSPGKIGRI